MVAYPVGYTMQYLCHQMFVHAATMGQKEHDWAICHGWREQSPPQSLHEKATAMESIDPNFTWQEIQGLYQEVHQLQRLPDGSHAVKGQHGRVTLRGNT